MPPDSHQPSFQRAHLRRLRPLLAPFLTGGLLALVVLPPFLDVGPRAVLYVAFSFLCHQIDARAFHVHDVAFAVCHRCTGIYAGLLVGTLLWPFVRRWRRVETLRRHAPRVLLAALVPAAIDWGLGALGLWLNTPASQFGTGALFGAVAGLYLGQGMDGLGATPPVTLPHSTSST